MTLVELRAKLRRDVDSALASEHLVALDGGHADTSVRRYAEKLLELLDAPTPPSRPSGYREG